MRKDKKLLKMVCESCRGTGLYQGFAEPKDTAVVCWTCDGTGCQTVEYSPFVERKQPKNKQIKYVKQSRGTSLLFGVGPMGPKVTLEEFYAGKLKSRTTKTR